MEADVCAGPPGSAAALADISTRSTKPAEADPDGQKAAEMLLQDMQNSDGELEDTMHRIQDFFALEGTFSQLTELVHRGEPTTRYFALQRASGGSATATKRPLQQASEPFGPSMRGGRDPPASRSQHKGDAVATAFLKQEGFLSGSGSGAAEERAGEPGADEAPALLGRQPQRREWTATSQGEEVPASELLVGEGAMGKSRATEGPRARVSFQEPGSGEDDLAGGTVHPRCGGVPSFAPQSPRPTNGTPATASLGSASAASTADSQAQAEAFTPPPLPQAGSPNSNFLWKMRLGMPPTADSAADRKNMRYLHIPERGRDQFQQFAKALKDQLSVECAESNPYVKALCAHRQEMNESALDLKNENVDTLAARLSSERADSLATLNMTEERRGRDVPCELDCRNKPCEAQQRFDMELALPELEARHQRRLFGNGFVPSPRSPTASTDRSTTAGSARSEPEARRVVFPGGVRDAAGAQARRTDTLRLRVGRNRLELSEDDRSDFLSAIGELDRPLAASITKTPISTCEGDVAPCPEDLDAEGDLD